MATKTWARVIDAVVVEIIPPLDAALVPGEDIFSSDIARTMIDVTSVTGIVAGWVKVNGVFAAPPPPPGPTVAQLLDHANTKQNLVLAQIWSFAVGTSSAPATATTRLDSAGQAAMNKLATWCLLNAGNANAAEPYSNVDYSALTLTLAQATSLVLQAGAIYSQSIAILNQVSAAIQAAAPTITSFAQVDAASWPSPAAS